MIRSTVLIFTLLIFAGCELLDNSSGNEDGSTNNKTVFILCEGEYGAPNASVWSVDLVTDELSGPLNWTNNNPLGDTGQSLRVHAGKLYTVLNNSHTVEILDLDSGTPEHEATLSVPNASPRYLEIIDDKGYLSCWGLNGILVFDIETLDILDTIHTPGWPEMLMNSPWGLLVTVPMRSYSDYTDMVLLVDTDDHYTVTDTFSVVPGPISLYIEGNTVLVASTSYDENYNTYNGISRIDPLAGTVSKNDLGLSFGFQKSLVELNGKIYRLTQTGLSEIGQDLTLEQNSSPIQIEGGYSARVLDSKLYIGLTDYMAPDTVVVFTENFELDTLYPVKALPTDFEIFNPED